MDLKLVHEVLLKKAKESNYTNLEMEQINYNYEELIIDFFLRREVLAELGKVTIKEKELQEIYELNKDKFLMEARVGIDTIFFLEKEKAEQILKEVTVKNFEEYKEKYDEKSETEKRTVEEAIPLSRIHPSIVEAINMIPKRGIANKIAKTEDGYHIVYLKSKEDSRLATYQEARDLIIEEMNKHLYSKIYNELIQKYMEEDVKMDLEKSKKNFGKEGNVGKRIVKYKK